jgi:hypothetical protein
LLPLAINANEAGGERQPPDTNRDASAQQSPHDRSERGVLIEIVGGAEGRNFCGSVTPNVHRR